MTWASVIYPYFILSSPTGLARIAYVDTIYIDTTWLKQEDGIIVLSEKMVYSFKENEKVIDGQKCFPWVYIYCRNKDHNTLFEIFSKLKIVAKYRHGCDFNPKNIVIDFDKDIYISFFSLSF